MTLTPLTGPAPQPPEAGLRSPAALRIAAGGTLPLGGGSARCKGQLRAAPAAPGPPAAPGEAVGPLPAQTRVNNSERSRTERAAPPLAQRPRSAAARLRRRPASPASARRRSHGPGSGKCTGEARLLRARRDRNGAEGAGPGERSPAK